MTRSPRPLLILCAFVTGACTAGGAERGAVSLPDSPPAAEGVPSSWRDVATPADRGRLSSAALAWSAALADARRAGFRKAVAAEGALLDPGAALPRPAPPPGRYLCRVIKLGAAQHGMRSFTAYQPFFCYVESDGALLTFVKETGSQRPAGRLWEDGDRRMVFLGGMALGDEKAPPAYGADPSRDIAGIVERVAPFRWRMVTPWPQVESKLDVMELIPFTAR